MRYRAGKGKILYAAESPPRTLLGGAQPGDAADRSMRSGVRLGAIARAVHEYRSWCKCCRGCVPERVNA